MKIPSNYTKAIIKTLKKNLMDLNIVYDYEDVPTVSLDKDDDILSNYSISTEIDMSRKQLFD